MDFRPLQRRDFWLQLEFTVSVAVVVAVTLMTLVLSIFGG